MFDENDEKTFYDSDSEEKKGQMEAKPYMMDPDHRLLLRNTKPLLQSRNTAVSRPHTSTHPDVSSCVSSRALTLLQACIKRTLSNSPLSNNSFIQTHKLRPETHTYCTCQSAEDWKKTRMKNRARADLHHPGVSRSLSLHSSGRKNAPK